MNIDHREFVSSSPEETMEAGRRLGARLSAGDIVGLIGEFGAGKTCFTKGIADGFGLKSARTVTSPSFVILNRYEGERGVLYHYDCWRLKDVSEFIDAGFYDAVRDGAVVVEWADLLPPPMREGFLCLVFRVEGERRRALRVDGFTKRHGELCSALFEPGASRQSR